MGKVRLGEDFDRACPAYAETPRGGKSSTRTVTGLWEVRTLTRPAWNVKDCGVSVLRRFTFVERYDRLDVRPEDVEKRKAAGEVLRFYAHHSVEHWMAREGSDICEYCGTDNTGSRDGFNCWMCGNC